MTREEVELDTIRRCVDALRRYAREKKAQKPVGRVGAIKAMAAYELAEVIEQMPRMETGNG